MRPSTFVIREVLEAPGTAGRTKYSVCEGNCTCVTSNGAASRYPPRSIAELARAQGVDLLNPPDYPAILAGLWETEKEAAAFREEIRKGRSASR